MDIYFNKSRLYEKNKVKKLVDESAELDGCEPFLKVSSDLNVHEEFISNYYAYDETVLIGYLNVFNPSYDEAEIYAVIHPQYRRKGVFKKLLSEAKKELDNFNVKKMILLCEESSVSASECFSHIGYTHNYSEYVMKYFGEKPQNSEDIAIRKVEKEDIGFCIEPIAQIYNLPFDEARVRAKNSISSADRETFALIMDGGIAGLCSFDKDGNTATIYGFAIVPEYRGRGLAKPFLSVIINKIFKRGINDVYLEVDSGNMVAYSIYKKFGFKNIQQIDYYTKG